MERVRHADKGQIECRFFQKVIDVSIDFSAKVAFLRRIDIGRIVGWKEEFRIHKCDNIEMLSNGVEALTPLLAKADDRRSGRSIRQHDRYPPEGFRATSWWG